MKQSIILAIFACCCLASASALATITTTTTRPTTTTQPFSSDLANNKTIYSYGANFCALEANATVVLNSLNGTKEGANITALLYEYVVYWYGPVYSNAISEVVK